jgi:DNA-binding beta-propeller fold protein YncE
MSNLKECKIIDSIDTVHSTRIISTPCEKFLIGTEGHSIFRYCLETKQKFRIAGSVSQHGYKDGTRDESRFKSPTSLALSKTCKTLYVADAFNNVIRAICVDTGITTTFTKDLDIPSEIKLSLNGNILYVKDCYKLRTIRIETGQVDTLLEYKIDIPDFALSPDGKHIYLCFETKILKFDINTQEIDIIFKGNGFCRYDISKNGQLLFVSNPIYKRIRIFDIVQKRIFGVINILFEPSYLFISKNEKQLYVSDNNNCKIQVFDISKYYTNFKTFTHAQFLKHSFLPRQVVESFSI